jgi:transcriptional regulator with XRE-family HTH domain
MIKRTATLYPNSVKALQALGQRMKDARLRRRFSAETVAARAGISRQTLAKIEAGADSVAMGNYFQVLVVLGLEKDINVVAHDDVLGRRLQDAELPQRRRAPRTGYASVEATQPAQFIAAEIREPEPSTAEIPSDDQKKAQ